LSVTILYITPTHIFTIMLFLAKQVNCYDMMSSLNKAFYK